MTRSYNSKLVELAETFRELEAELEAGEYETNLEDAIEWAFKPKVVGGKGGKASPQPPWLKFLSKASQTLNKAITYLGPPTKATELKNELLLAETHLGDAIKGILKAITGNKQTRVINALNNALNRIDYARKQQARGDIDFASVSLNGAIENIKIARDEIGLQSVPPPSPSQGEAEAIFARNIEAELEQILESKDVLQKNYMYLSSDLEYDPEFDLKQSYASKSEMLQGIRQLEAGFKGLPGKRIPDDHRLTELQRNALKENIRLVINKTIASVKSKQASPESIRRQLSNPRFRFLNQVPDARDALRIALNGTGVSLPKRSLLVI